ncbi:MAG TPA: hypothetical protein DCP53_08210 [Elusimicrobia bacterium]|nr:hypothetical protein [Elusimicrobiota bacterium]
MFKKGYPLKEIFKKIRNAFYKIHCNLSSTFYKIFKGKYSFTGFTLVEMILTIVILSIVVLSLTKIQYFMSTNSLRIKEKSFATQKVIQMMEELRSLVAGAEKSQISLLDDYDDGIKYSPVLTSDKSVTDPQSPSSNNVKINNGWKYLRRISVLKNPEDGAFTRRIYIRVYKASSNTSELLAETMGILKTIAREDLPTQVMDIYVIAIENVPGWWSTMSSMKSMFDGVMQDFQVRNPRLALRIHWITRMAYGRDTEYRPYINNTKNTYDDAMPYVYFYPGKTKTDTLVNTKFYNPDMIQGKILADTVWYPIEDYAMSDQYNHAVRYPEEKRLYDKYKPAEPSLRMLLEEMNTVPDKFKNMLLINLHGELLPCPPMRNYSDAAKDPGTAANRYVRAVTHPEKLRYSNTSETVKLRVYSYVTNPENITMWSDTSASTVTVYLPYKITDTSDITVTKIDGKMPADYLIDNTSSIGTIIVLRNTPLKHTLNQGYNSGNKGLPISQRLYGLEYIPCPIEIGASAFNRNLSWADATSAKNTASWTISFDGGVFTSNGEYRVETRIGNNIYTNTTTYFEDDFPNLSKTYFWIGTNPPVTEKYQFIGDPRHCPYLDVKEDHRYNIWFSTFDTTFTGTNYKFFKSNDIISGTRQYGTGWGALDTGVPYNGLIEVDIPRFFQIYREGILNTQSIWSAMTGSSFYYYGCGGEFGSDKDPFTKSIRFKKQPWTNNDAQNGVNTYYDEIFTPSHDGGVCGRYVVARRENPLTPNTWYAKYWLGELYPDDQYVSQWQPNGNLLTGNTSPNTFFRVAYSSFSVFQNEFKPPYKRIAVKTSGKGCASFINGDSACSSFMQFNNISNHKHFRHADGGSDKRIDSTTSVIKDPPPGSSTYGTSMGQPTNTLITEFPEMFNFTITTSTKKTPRPFTANCNNDNPDDWKDSIYMAIRSSISFSRIYYNSNYDPYAIAGFTPYFASAVLKMRYPHLWNPAPIPIANETNTDPHSAYFVISGLEPQGNTGAGEMGKYVLMSMFRTFLDAGRYKSVDWISQIPLIDLTKPTVADEIIDPISTDIIWATHWKRWDGKDYTKEYELSISTYVYSEETPLGFNIKYSNDNGQSWYFCGDVSNNIPSNTISTKCGERNSSYFSFTTSTFSWKVSDSIITRGSYILRVECYRQNTNLHYSYDQVQIYINKQ